eukprot:4030146-Amphidinium_carterae.1
MPLVCWGSSAGDYIVTRTLRTCSMMDALEAAARQLSKEVSLQTALSDGDKLFGAMAEADATLRDVRTSFIESLITKLISLFSLLWPSPQTTVVL